jgi:hypothetical protein
MSPIGPGTRKALLLPILLALSSLSCSTVSSLWTPPTPTATPTAEPTATPSATPEALLTEEQRGDYLVILRYVSDAVRERFVPVSDFLNLQGYTATIDEGPSRIGDMDVFLYGSPACNDAIDDLILLLHDRLALQDLDRVRFDPNDLSHTKKNIVIQIKDIDRFDPGL